MKLFNNLDSRLRGKDSHLSHYRLSREGREFIRLIYFTRFDLFSKFRSFFMFHFQQNFGTALAKRLI